MKIRADNVMSVRARKGGLPPRHDTPPVAIAPSDLSHHTPGFQRFHASSQGDMAILTGGPDPPRDDRVSRNPGFPHRPVAASGDRTAHYIVQSTSIDRKIPYTY
jgi:hypothetical protein